jgi:hypothetical protein
VSGYVADHGPLLKPFNLNPGTWKEEDKLALEKGNYRPWAKKVYATIGLQSGTTHWLDPSELCPSFKMYPHAHRIWQDNDVAIRSFLSLTCVSSEHTYVEACTSAADMWATIRTRHTKHGPLDQVNRLCTAMGIQFADDPDSWAATLDRISELNKAVWASEAPTAKGIHTVLLLHALAPFPAFVDSLLAVPDLDPAYITACLGAKQQMPKSSSLTVLAATSTKPNTKKPKEREHCNNLSCKSPGGHSFPYCVAPGGGMAGKSVDEAMSKKRADGGRASGGRMKVGRDKDGYACVTIEGTNYRLVPPAPDSAQAPPTAQFAHINEYTALCTDDVADTTYDLETFHVEDDLQVSLNWGAFTANETSSGDYELYVDMGANMDISLCREDFATFTPIAPCAVKGFQESSINAVGTGTIITDKFVMRHALFVLNASIHLMSVSSLCRNNSYTCHFDATTAWITDTPGNVVCTGSLQPTRGLYKLHCSPSPNPFFSPPVTASAVSIDRLHRRLSHAHHQAVADLFQHQLVDGMDLDPSSKATPCDACFRGKQVAAAIPKLREGDKSKEALDLVFVDLCGAFNTRSWSGNNYILDIVDDATTSGYCIPIADKVCALDALMAWQLAIEHAWANR